jgi:hypothetical protein
VSKLLKKAAQATATEPATDQTGSDILSQTPRTVDLFDLTLIANSTATQNRVGLNMAKVYEYAEEMKEAPDTFGGFPAVWLVEDADESRHWIARGHHRIAAAKQAGLTLFPAKVFTGKQRDAILLGAGSNAEHGYKRSRDDLQHELDLFLLDDEWGKWSDGYIAKLVKCSRKTVTNRRDKLIEDGLISESGERIYKDRHGHINVMQTGGIQQANSARTRTTLTDREIEAVIATELGRRVTSGRIADKIEWLRKHRTFTHYTAIVNEGKTSTDDAFAAIADRMIANLEIELQSLHARNEQTAANLGKLGRFVAPNPPDTETVQDTPSNRAPTPPFSPTLFWSQMRTLAEHLDAAAPLLRHLATHCPPDLQASVSADDADRLVALAAAARAAGDLAKQGRLAA